MGVTFAEGSEGPDGFYLDSNGNPLPVSASELERYTYCPVSWRLAKEGAAGVGEAITIGMEIHKQIHEGMNEFQTSLIKLRRELLIWTWWYGIIIAFAIDAVAFVYIDDLMNAPIELAKILSMWSVSFLAAAILSIVIPWRNWLNMEPTVSEIETLSKNFESTGLKPTWNPIGFLGGWFSGGKTEAGLLLATIVIGLHAIGLAAADNRSQAGFILIVTAFVWTFLATWQLQKSLFAENEMIENRGRAGLDEDTQLVYSDDDESSGLLRDEETGLRGRPDQIVIIDGERLAARAAPFRSMTIPPETMCTSVTA